MASRRIMTPHKHFLIENMHDDTQVQEYFESVYQYLDQVALPGSDYSDHLQVRFNQLFELENHLKQTVAINYKLYSGVLNTLNELQVQYNLLKDENFVSTQRLLSL